MWTGYEEALVRYGLEVCRVWTAGGRCDTCAATMLAGSACSAGAADVGSGGAAVRTQDGLAATGDLPPWPGDAAFHRRHRSALLRKHPDFYGALFPGVPDDLPYVWPASDRERADGGWSGTSTKRMVS